MSLSLSLSWHQCVLILTSRIHRRTDRQLTREFLALSAVVGRTFKLEGQDSPRKQDGATDSATMMEVDRTDLKGERPGVGATRDTPGTPQAHEGAPASAQDMETDDIDNEGERQGAAATRGGTGTPRARAGTSASAQPMEEDDREHEGWGQGVTATRDDTSTPRESAGASASVQPMEQEDDTAHGGADQHDDGHRSGKAAWTKTKRNRTRKPRRTREADKHKLI